MTIKVIGVDLGKKSFHLVGRDVNDQQVLKKKLTRHNLLEFLANCEQTTIAMESCGGSHWLARQCEALGHKVKLIPPQYVKAYVKTNKNDFIDADAIAEASGRPSMRFVAVKTEVAQVISVIHKIRSGYIKDRTACMCRIGSILLEFGMSLPKGHATMKSLFVWIAKQNIPIPPLLEQELIDHHAHYLALNKKIAEQDKKLTQVEQQDERVQRLLTIPGIGKLTATRCIADIASPEHFKNGRELAAWLGLVPRQYSTGGKNNLLGISKRGNKTLRSLFIHGARAMLSKPNIAAKSYGDWILALRARKPFNVAVVALANKLARIAWSVLTTNKPFEAQV